MDFQGPIKIMFWHLILIGILIIVLSLIAGCSHGRRSRIKVPRIYIHDAHRGLFIRDLKNKDVLTYKEGHGLLCIQEKDMRSLIDEAITEKVYGGRK